MRTYNFAPYRKMLKPPLRLTLSKSQIHIPREVYDLMGRPKRMLVHYDRENKAIKLEPSDHAYSRKVNELRERYYAISITLAKLMPLGVYPLEDKEKFIFVQHDEYV